MYFERMRKVVVGGVCLLLLAACSGNAATPPSIDAGDPLVATSSQLIDSAGQISIPEIGQVAPDFAYTLPDGTTQKLSGLRGKKVLLNFWATWCAPCRNEMPDLQRMLDAKGEKVVVLGVNKAEQPDLIAPYAREVGVHFPLIPNPDGDIAGRYAAINLPTSYFINTDGTIGLRKTGVMNESFIMNHVDELK